MDTKRDRETQQITNIVLKQKDGQLVHKLHLAEGARVVLVRNVDVSDGLLNSAMGTITGFYPQLEPENPNYKPKYILVQFDDELTGKNRRSKYKNLFGNSASTPISTQTVPVKKGVISASRTQFPLKLARASTIHKAQGKTLDHVVVCMKGSYKAGQMYTALSRVKTLEGLYILGELSRTCSKIDKHIQNEMSRLRTTKLFNIRSPTALTVDTQVQLSLLNINSLKPHLLCLQKDEALSMSHICCLTETWLKESDKNDILQLTESHQMYRRDRPSVGATTAHGGVAIYIKELFHVLQEYDIDSISLEYIALLLEHRANGHRILVVNVYNSPSTPITAFLHSFDKLLAILPVRHLPTFLVGDFNINAVSKSSSFTKLQQVTKHYGFVQYVDKPTHRSGNTLDHIYINRDVSTTAKVLYTPVHYTDHIHVQLVVELEDLFKTL